MIVELFGLPGSGKTSLAKSFAEEGAFLIPAPQKWDMLGEALLFCLRHPFRATRLFFFIITQAPRGKKNFLLANLFFATGAKYMRASRISRKGGVAVIDQGHFQSLLSLFEKTPEEHILRMLIHILPKPGMLLVLDTPKDERERRILKRGRAIRKTAAESVFPKALSLFQTEHIPHMVIPGVLGTKLTSLLSEHVSYVTHARMPTEKAHGVSIAHMCAAFANAGRKVLLIIPDRKNPIKKDIYSYYGVPNNFSVRTVPPIDFLGAGLTNPFFFFLQRALFLFSITSASIPAGIVYTREPEIAWRFSKTHLVIFEAHRWPEGFAGRLQSWLVERSELVVCNSRGTETVAQRFGVAHTLVLPNGFDAEHFKNVVREPREKLGLPEGILALYVGSEGVGKGAGVVRKAAEKINRDGVNVALMGGAHHRVLHSEVPRYLASADMLLLPNTREGESEDFTSPIKLFEYLAAGKAIIASDLPSIREILKEGDAFFVSPGDAEALAGAIETLANDEALRARLAARAKELSHSYTWDMRATRILEAITA